LFSLDDLRKYQNFILYTLLALGWFGAVASAVFLFGIGIRRPNLQPKQPIQFPHHVHILTVGLECTYCHKYPEQSIHAGLPDAELCMECHQAIATDRPEIIKLTNLYQKGQPINWVRVYQYQDWVYFSHKRHVRSGVQCQECHGPVDLMTTVQRIPYIGMGWCIHCHRNRDAPIECNTCHK
jgi:hypothetical protein